MNNIYEIADNRICPECGAVAGRCSHLQAHKTTRFISSNGEGSAWRDDWSPSEIATAKRLKEMGLSNWIIAERLGRSSDAVKIRLRNAA